MFLARIHARLRRYDRDAKTTALRAISVFIGLSLFTACAPISERTTRPLSSDVTDASLSKDWVWHLLGTKALPVRDEIRDAYRYERTQKYTKISDFRYHYYEPEGRVEPVGFSLINRGSKRINPRGLGRSGAIRQFSFYFADRARENIYLEIIDDVRLSKRFSFDNMFREMHFFPRLQLPSVLPVEAGRKLQVTLPTGERVVFDAISKEIVDGVLVEGPIDFNTNRHKRANPKVRYRGRHLVITVAQRGEAPRRDRVWGQTKYAEASYPAKFDNPCRLSPRYIWDQHAERGDVDPKLIMLHHSDDTLFDVIEQQCGWDLSELRSNAPLTAATTPHGS